MSASPASVLPHRTKRSCSIHPRIRAPECQSRPRFHSFGELCKGVVRSEETAISRFVRSSIAGSDKHLRS